MGKINISIEEWKGGIRMGVVREDGVIRARRPIKDYESVTVDDLKRVYNSNNTLFENRRRLTNFYETHDLVDVKRDRKSPVSRPPRDTAQYLVSGVVRGRIIERRSHKLGTPLASSPEKAREYAWNSFLKQLGAIMGDSYSADEGSKFLDSVTNVKEGWVYYTDRR